MKIVIVGGGTAGWLAACYLSRFNHSTKTPNEIVVIESSKIPIIGAGEGSTGIFTKILNRDFKAWNLNEVDFLTKTESTLKLGINFKDWNGKGTQFYSPVQPSETTMASIDNHLLVCHMLGNYYDSSPSGYLMANGISTYSPNGSTIFGHSYHFDAHKVGKYFKEHAMKIGGVKTIDTEITSINKDSLTGELKSVETTIGNIEGDMWIDCSGFSRVLIEPMGGGWVSYKDYLLTNAAIPFIEKYKPNEVPNLETLSQAQPNGWMWQIPTQERYGCGYVYSDNHTTFEKAVEELEKNIGRKIEPIRNLKFEPGRVANPWVKNVIAIGLSQGFVEPLEATSIHATIVQLDFLCSNAINFAYDKNTSAFQANINRYNKFVNFFFDDIKDLIQIHYMTEREDTPFWKDLKYSVKKTDFVSDILDICKHRSPSMLDFNFYHGSGNWGVWCWTLIGLGHITKEIAEKTIMAYRNTDEMISGTYNAIKHRNRMNEIKCMNNSEFMQFLKKQKEKNGYSK
jgi:flavin-dependent dehydrogenase